METTIKKGRPRGIFAKKALEQIVRDDADAEIESIEAAAPVSSKPVSDLRPVMREEDPRALAAKRAAELRGHLGDDVVDANDKYHIDPDIIPDGWTYMWRRYAMFNKEDPSYISKLQRSGWEPVPRTRHPYLMPDNTDSNTIMLDGMVLMQCPTEIVDERRMAEAKKAKDQVRFKEQQLSGAPDGQFTRDHDQARPKIKKSYEAMPVPEK